MFRLLRADEIDVRVQQVKEKGAVLLLYKDARCDMNILDETVGPMNWKREHTRDNRNCIVSIWDKEKQQWISKEDTGTESNTEKEKGLASDSFKRACFNWGIGRELYTAPFTWIPSSKFKIKKTGDKYSTYDKFYVDTISYDKNRVITKLVIVNQSTKEVCFVYGDKDLEKPIPSAKQEKSKKEIAINMITKLVDTDPIYVEKINIILGEMKVDNLNNMNEKQLKDCYNKLKGGK
jgi:hypothetical protein